jgi:hypothetical protein
VAREQADGVTDRFGGRREGRSSPEGFSVAEGFGGGEETAARWRSGWRGCTRWHGAWGGVEMVGGWLERAAYGGSVQPKRNGGGGAEEQLRALAGSSGELPASVRSSRRPRRCFAVAQ